VHCDTSARALLTYIPAESYTFAVNVGWAVPYQYRNFDELWSHYKARVTTWPSGIWSRPVWYGTKFHLWVREVRPGQWEGWWELEDKDVDHGGLPTHYTVRNLRIGPGLTPLLERGLEKPRG
jgi:hypothetical protein